MPIKEEKMQHWLDKTVKDEKVVLVIRLRDEHCLKFVQIARQVQMGKSWCQQNYHKAKRAM